MKIGVILGSVREGRSGEGVAKWVMEVAGKRTDATYELLDLKTFDLPILTAATLPAAAKGKYDDPQVQTWGDAVGACDGFIFITAEYNHGVPGAFKNAFDSLGVEWMGKPVGFVSYGAESGVRAVEHWRQVVANFSMVGVRNQVSCGLFTEFGKDGFTPNDRREGELNSVLDSVVGLVPKLGS